MPSAFAFPEPTEPTDAALVIIDMQLLPFVLGAVADLQDRKYWQTDADWYRASESISSFLECSMSTCASDLLAGQDRLYRLIDSGLNGTVYTADGDPVVITPEIGDVPPTVAELPGLIARLDHVEVMLDALPGILDPGWFGYGGEKATIADIVRSLRVGSTSQSTETIDSLQEILGAGADISSMGDMIADLFTGSVTAVEEGGIFLLLAGASIGTIAALGAIAQNQITQASLLNRIIHDLDGGGFGLSDDNILQAIRGDTPASDTRNVIDAMVAALASLTVGDPDVLAKLEEIRALLA
jgi:hypothetical protein